MTVDLENGHEKPATSFVNGYHASPAPQSIYNNRHKPESQTLPHPNATPMRVTSVKSGRATDVVLVTDEQATQTETKHGRRAETTQQQ